MKFKSSRWHPIALVLSVLNFAGAGYAVAAAEPMHAAGHVVLALAFGLWARHLRQGSGGSDLDRMRQQLEDHAAALEDAQTTLDNQSTQLAELQERVDFTERVLAQARDRLELKPRDERE